MLEFEGTARYRPVRALGEGGMGVVYEVEDRERQQHVALKLLKYRDVETMYRMKREFRVVGDVTHPNLVSLYDLVVDDERCFFTMELLSGENLIEFCRPDGRLDPRRVRDAFPQLVAAVSALHRAGVVHRDLKPSNVVVEPGGRLVLLDFGLVADLGRDDSLEGRIVGSVEYMAPEQAAGTGVTAASDAYAIGIMLYEALTGRVPFTGSIMEVLLAKQTDTPAAPSSIDPMVPADLAELSMRLLAIEPGERPDADAMLAALGGSPPVTAPTPARASITRLVRLSGREDELAQLDASFAEIDGGGCGAAVVRGPSGIGKSALIRHYLREIERRDDVALLCLEGRCYERETVPYKAMDGLVDELASYLVRLSDEDVRQLIPERPELLRRLFPVLGRVPAIAAATSAGPIPDPQELRSQAFGALRQLLQAIGARRRLVLFLDDLQWVDENSIALLSDVLRPPDPPSLLLLLCSRDESAHRAPTTNTHAVVTPGLDVAARVRRTGLERLLVALDMPVRDIRLGPLPADAAIQLAGELLGGSDPELAARVAREAAGIPLFIGELCLYLEAAPGRRETGVALDEVLRARVGDLPESCRRVLECCAVANEPVSARVLATALAFTPDDVARDLRYLRTARLIRSSGGAAANLVEPYHDRIRHSARKQLDEAAVRALHRGLALALEQYGEGDPERLAWHWRGAGQDLRAAELARDAAELAARAVDFERAANLYRMVLELGDVAPDETRALQTALGEALANAGRPEEAAVEFQKASVGADAATRLDLHNRSAGELLRGGYVTEGIQAIRAVLSEIGLHLARTPWRALLSVAWRRAWLRVRGLRWRVRLESEIPKATLTKLDILYSVSISLAIVDNIRGADFQARHMLLALQVGEPSRLGRAFGVEAGYLVSLGYERRTRRVAELAYELRKEHGSPQGPFDLWALGGIHYFLENSWREAIAKFQAVETELRTTYQHRGWALDTIQAYNLFSRLYMGDLPGLARMVPALTREAERRGDLYAAVNFRTRLNLVWLMRDDVSGAKADLEDAVSSWQPLAHGYQVQHYWALVSRCELELYRGDPDAARALFERELAPLRRSLLTRVPMVKVEIDHMRGRIELARAQLVADPRERARILRVVSKQARRLDHLQPPLAGMLALLLRAGIANLHGDRAAAIQFLRRAVRWLERTETGLYSRPARRALALATGGAEGAELLAAADAALVEAEVANPAAMTRVFVPGFG